MGIYHPYCLEHHREWLGGDSYSTAWVALVPHVNDLSRPAWPEALEYLRSHQLADGGWGEPHIFYAHDRTISTLAAIKALHTWQGVCDSTEHIRRGLAALRNYADYLPREPYEPAGFEMLLPRLRDDLTPLYGSELPLDRWQPIELAHQEKLALIPHLHPDPSKPQSWWFSLEMLPEDCLAPLDDAILDVYGSVATATAATAAYLAARRRAGGDLPAAANYLDRLVRTWGGGVPYCWPEEVFEEIWALDNYRRVGLDPTTPTIVSSIESIQKAWYRNTPGLAFSDLFPVNDGDDTVVGYTVLAWAGAAPPDDGPVMEYFDGDHFLTYLSERGASASVNIHALTMLRAQPGFPHRDVAEKVSAWLRDHMRQDVPFEDKWHLSPYYSTAHAIPAFAGWDDFAARHCIDFILERQRIDGGWGWFGYSTLEETAHCVIGLSCAYKQGLLSDDSALAKAGRYFDANADRQAVEALWIAKTLFCPSRIVNAALFSAQAALTDLGFISRRTAA